MQALFRLFRLIQDPKLYQYIVVGGISALVDIVLFLALKSMLPVHYLIIATFTFIFATLVNYVLCTRYVFRDQYRHSSQKRIFLVYVVSGIGLILHHSMLMFCFEGLALPILFSKIIAMGSAFGWNFLSRKHFVFAT